MSEYTITSAVYANANESAAILLTEEFGQVLATQADRPDLWALMLASGVAIAPFELPAPPVPFSVTDRQFAQALAETGKITWPEAQAWGARGEIPAALSQAVDAIEDETDRNRALMFLGSAQTFERHHPMTTTLAASMEWTDSELDDLWRFAATL